MNDSNEGCADTSVEHARRIPLVARGDAPGDLVAIAAHEGPRVKRAAAASVASPQRTIGEILLEHGYVTEEDLAAAVQRQQETGFPLGQILVEAGAITRLELASALAVQWADVAPARAPLEEQTGRSRAARQDDEDEEAEAPLFSYGPPAGDDAWRDEIRTAARAFAQRLDAVEQTLDELRGDAGDQPDIDVEARFGELLGPLARHVDETAHRMQAVEAAVEELGAQGRSVGEAAEALKEELTRRATAATSAIEQLAARLEERPEGAGAADVTALRTEVAHLRAEVTAFAAAPAGDQTARDQLADLSARVDALADPTSLEELRRALDALAERPASDPVLAGRLQELAARVEELTVERPAGDPELTGRVDELSEIVGGLTAAMAEARERPVEDAGLEARVDELARRVHVLADASEAAAGSEAKLQSLTAQLNDVVDRVARIQHEPDESRFAALTARLDELERSSANGEARAPSGDGLDAAAMEQLTARIAEASASWDRDRAALEARVAELSERVANAPAASGEAPAGSAPPNEHDLNRLWFAVERLSLQLTEHHRTLGLLMGGAAGEGQLDALAARVDLLERLGGAAPPADGSGGTATGSGAYGDLAVLTRRVEEVAQASEAGREKLLTQIEQMMSSLDWRFQRLESGGEAA